jgi:hypothetical protein
LLVVAAALACTDAGATPSDQLQVVTDEVQTLAQPAAHQVLSALFNLTDDVAGAFLNTADINLDVHDTNDNLPDPSESPFPYYPDWPPDSDKYLPVYQNYAATYHDTVDYKWVVFYVNHLSGNTIDTCASIEAGTSSFGQPNTVSKFPSNRWSFIFVTDIQHREQVGCNFATDEQLENEMIHLVAHEYGHQRAGLTDNNDQYRGLYHTGPVPRDREDVMARPPHYSELWNHSDPVFDSFGFEQAGDHFTCRGNLVSNRSVH